jgi:hypothetical protein
MATTTSGLVFHFPVAASPAKIPTLLRVLLYADAPVLKDSDLDQMALEQSTDHNRFIEARVLSEDILGLIRKTKEGFVLTPRAHVILKKRESVQYDLLHYLFYTAWNEEDPTKNARSWFYRTICDNLWGMQEFVLDREMRQTFTQQLSDQIQITKDFQEVRGIEKVSIGIQTMDGAREWLRTLTPVVIDTSAKKEEKFHRRVTCSAELFLLALSRSCQLCGSEIGMDVLLSVQRREEISRLCLLEALQFDRILDWVLPIFPQFVSQGTRTGSYGRFVRLHRFVKVEDFA